MRKLKSNYLPRRYSDADIKTSEEDDTEDAGKMPADDDDIAV